MLNGIIILIMFLLTCIVGVPVALAIGVTTVGGFFLLDGDMFTLGQKMYSSLNTPAYLCIPLYVLATSIMSRGKLLEKIVLFFQTWVGRIRGGLAYVNVLDSMVFAGISGSSTADMSSLGLIEVEMMTQAGYPRDYATCLSASSATIAPVIPPSTTMIIYAMAAGGISIGKLFAGGMIPGLLYGGAMLGLCTYFAIKDHHPRSEHKIPLKEKLKVTVSSIPVLVLPLIIFGTITFGICTVVEAGAISVLYAIVITFIRKTMTIKTLSKALVESAILTGAVTLIVAASAAMSWMIIALNIPQALTAFCETTLHTAGGFLLFVNILLVIIGCLMDSTPALLLLVPVLTPIAYSYGIDPIHFGIVVCLNLTVGMITPPIGMMLFVSSNVTGIPLSRLYRKIWPFVIVCFVILLLVTYVPDIVTFIPSLMK